MVPPPLYTVLIVGNRSTGKTTYIHRIMGMKWDEIEIEREQQEPDPVILYYLPIPDSDGIVRVIELNHVSATGGYTHVPSEYVGLINKIIVFAAFDNEYSIQDITFHTNTYSFIEAPIHAVINKKDLMENASTEIQNSAIAAVSSMQMHMISSIHLISCKSDNLLNLITREPPDPHIIDDDDTYT